MADFCSRCSPDYFDIDLAFEALNLVPGHSVNILCEGCNLRAIYKDKSGKLYFGRLIEGEIVIEPVRFEEI